MYFQLSRGRAATGIPQETTLEVAEAVATVESEGVKVNWIDRRLERSSRLRTTSDLNRMLIN